MTQVKMPEPVAWVRRHPDGALTTEFLEDAVIEPVRKRSGAWLPLITTTQAEAYADARVREQLEIALAEAKRVSDKYGYGYYGSEVDAVDEVAESIRAMIPTDPRPGQP